MSTPDEIEEALNVVARFIGRAVGVQGDLDALAALSEVKRYLEVLDFAATNRWERMAAAEDLLRERIDKDPKLDENILANYPGSWEYRARQALKGAS
jgi:hypothetical protein